VVDHRTSELRGVRDAVPNARKLDEGTCGDVEEQVVVVSKIEGDQVTLDGNHPLAGMNLHFEVTIREVRAATTEEIEHGHVHGPGGHAH
jgi:FKBP-type peptidyl-prolyl cis-trans isomerase SlyD